MSQLREAPAYQEYAAAMMAKLEYRTMTLQDRGLFYTMRLECWVNNSLPSDQSKLAKILGCDAAEIAASLPAVMPFFHSDGQQITCPELIAYRAHLDAQRERMSDGGKRSAEGKKKKSKTAGNPATTGDASTLPTTLQPPMQAPRKVLVQSKPVQPSQVKTDSSSAAVDPWIADYTATEQAETPKRVRVTI